MASQETARTVLETAGRVKYHCEFQRSWLVGSKQRQYCHLLHLQGGQERMLRDQCGHYLSPGGASGCQIYSGREEQDQAEHGGLQAYHYLEDQVRCRGVLQADHELPCTSRSYSLTLCKLTDVRLQAPKPRNIEKDVKVFPWKMLGTALRKIISKYSASYLTGEELGTAGKAVPQPIGWAPGRTPPPQLPPAPAVSQAEGEGKGDVTPTPGSSGETDSADVTPASRAMSGRSMSLGASRPPPISLATVPEDPMQQQPPFQDVLTTPTK